MGHAFTFTLQDVLIRLKRMDGFDTLWQPGHRPRRHRHPGGGRAQLAAEGKTKEDLGRDGLRGARLEVEGRVGRHDHPAAQAAGRLVRLVAPALHDGRGPVPRGARGLRAALRRGPDLPRRLHRQLVPALPDGALGPGGRARGARRRVRLHQVRTRSRSAPCGRRRSSATRAWPCIPTTRATRSTSAATSRSSPSTGPSPCGWWRTKPSIPSSAPASSRSRRATTRSTSRSASVTACRSAPSSASTAR